MSWWWRTKPRSILKAIQWFPYFCELEGKNWELKNNIHDENGNLMSVHPLRREYIYNAHKEEKPMCEISLNSFLKYKEGKKDIESTARNDKTTYEFFGFSFLDKHGRIKITDVGRKIADGKFDAEDYLKQLLKMHFPNPITTNLKGFLGENYIFPLDLFLKAMDKYEYLNRSEISILFGCTSSKNYNKTLEGIGRFREKYQQLKNKQKIEDIKNICKEVYLETFGNLDNDLDTYYSYAEAFCRSLVYTGIFTNSGRSIFTKIKVPNYSKVKFRMLVEKYEFKKVNFTGVEEYMKWFGSLSSTELPWENGETRKDLIKDKIIFIENLKNNDGFITKYNGNIINDIEEKVANAQKIIKNDNVTIASLQDLEDELVNFITSINEKEFIRNLSKTKEARDEIVEKYDEILDAIDMGALWLEVNTWKSLLAIDGDNKTVKRNFNVEEDLSPKSFAPGIGNTPDMEMYVEDYIVIPEVSLMTGIRQWEHEASSVIDHVLSFIEDNKEKKVIGLFLSSSINIRTKWQFFMLNKESWVGKPVPVIPLTISQYKKIISLLYDYEKNINTLIELLFKIHELAIQTEKYTDWFFEIDKYLKEWEKSIINV